MPEQVDPDPEEFLIGSNEGTKRFAGGKPVAEHVVGPMLEERYAPFLEPAQEDAPHERRPKAWVEAEELRDRLIGTLVGYAYPLFPCTYTVNRTSGLRTLP